MSFKKMTITGALGLLLCSASQSLPAWAQADPADDQATADTPIGDKWALVIGISKFQNPSLNLSYPAKDAEDFYNYLINQAHFAKDHVHLLTDEDATKERIMTELGDMWLPRAASPNDLVVIFISSHGSPSNMDVAGDNYLVAYNTDPNLLYATGLEMQEMMNALKLRIHANRVVLILDACHSGSAQTAKGLTRVANFDSDAIAQGSGQLVICSSRPSQVSWESKRYDNGVFTHYLLQGLQSNGDRTKLADAFDVLKNGVEGEVLHDRGELQTPVIKMKWEGSDLVLAAIPAHPQRAPELERLLPKVSTPIASSKGAAITALKPEPELELRRMLNQIKLEALPAIISDVENFTESKPIWEIDWSSFSGNKVALENLQHQGLDHIVDALRNIAADSIGKKALKGAIKKIVVRNVGSPKHRKLAFSGGTLEVLCDWDHGWDGYPKAEEIQVVLENNL